VLFVRVTVFIPILDLPALPVGVKAVLLVREPKKNALIVRGEVLRVMRIFLAAFVMVRELFKRSALQTISL